MRGFMTRYLVCLLVTAGLAVPDAVWAAGRTRSGSRKPTVSRPDEDKAYKLEDVMKAPKEYLERQVFFYCRYASTANLFKTVNTRFNATEHANFAVWPDKTVLWETEGRRNVLPTLYVSKNDSENLDILRQVEKYELLAITGYVLNVYARYPWILVTKIERVETPGDKLCEQVVEHMQAGYEALAKDFGGVAARHFEQALQFGLPCEYQAKAYKQLACAYYLDNQLDKAQDYLRLAVEVDPTDPLLHLALADVSLKMGDAEEAIAHCIFAMERSGRYPQAYGIMGEAVSMQGEYVKAFNHLNAAANTPGITPREKAMINVRRARIYVRAERYADAAQVYAAVSEPGEALGAEPWLHNEVGLFYESLYLISGDARYLDSALAAYGEAAKLSRLSDAAILYNQAETEFRRQKQAATPDYHLVREILGEINKVEPECAAARILEGRLLYAEGQADEADLRYQSVARLIGDDAMALMSLAEAYLDLAMYSEAASTVIRAKSIQPWNIRIQAVGRFLDGTIQPMVDMQNQQAVETYVIPEAELEYDIYQPGEEQIYDGGEYQVIPETSPEIITPLFQSSGAQPARRRGDVLKAGNRQQAAPAEATYRLDGHLLTARPEDGVRVGVNGMAKRRPPEIQASATPTPPGRKIPPYPVAEVKLDGAGLGPASTRGEAPKPAVNPLNLGYVPASSDDQSATDAKEEEAVDERQDFGMVTGSSEALASMPLWRHEITTDAGIPPFSFEPDLSPVIIAGVQASDDKPDDLPVRNVNLYRSVGGRQAAEVTYGKKPVTPRPLPDMSGMAPSGDGTVHRAEVSLPSTAPGVGMASDYQPGN